MKINEIKFGSLLSYLNLFINIFVQLLYTPIMIRYLGRSEYGLYNTVASVISIISLISLGFNSGYIKYYSIYKGKDDKDSINKLNGLYLIIFIIIGIAALLCGLFFTFNLNLVFSDGLTPDEYEIAKWLMLILTINLAVSFPMSVFSNIITAHEKFVFLKLLAIVRTLLSPLITLPLLLIGFKSIAMVVVTASVNLFIDMLYLFFVLCRLKCKFVFHGFEKGIFGSIFKYTIFVAIHLIVDQINTNLDKFILGRFRGTDAVAVYSVGASLYSYYITVGLAFVSFFAPRVHRIVAEETDRVCLKNRLTELFVKVGRIQYIVVSLVASGYVFFGKQFIFYWAGAGYDDAYYVGLCLILPGFIDLIQNIGIEIQRAQNKHMFRAVVYICMAVVNIIVSVILCQYLGAIGCAIGTGISLILVQGVIINIYYQKQCNLDIKKFWLSILRMSIALIPPVALGIIITIFVNINSLIMLILMILLYACVFGVSMWFLGFNEYEKGLFVGVLRKLSRKSSKG